MSKKQRKPTPKKDPIDRFMSHVNLDGGFAGGMSTQCWVFEEKGKQEYSSRTSFNSGNNRIVSAHIFSYENFVGKRNKGEIIYQVCRNRHCVNPEHLRIGTMRDSMGSVYEKFGILYKVCPRCERELPYNDEFYYPAKGKGLKFTSLCKECSVETVIERRNKYWTNTLWHESKRGAIGRGLVFEITEQDIRDLYEKQGGRCYWTGIELNPSVISKFPSKPSVDRLDNSKGYTKDNVVICCLAINIGRNSSSKSTFEDFINKLKEKIDTSLWRSNEEN